MAIALIPSALKLRCIDVLLGTWKTWLLHQGRKKYPKTWSSWAAESLSDEPVIVIRSDLQSELTGLICQEFPDAEVKLQLGYIIIPPRKVVKLHTNPVVAR